MAKKIVLIDDMDGDTEGAVTVEFSLKGVDYEIDLATANDKKLEKALAPFIAAARVVTPESKPAKKVPAKKAVKATAKPGANFVGRADQLKAKREWARKNGFPNVSDRGRLPREAEEAFDKAHEGGVEFSHAG